MSDWQTWFIRGLTLLVIVCPCAFVISTPVSVVSGVTSAAKNGVPIKDSNYLEAMGEVDGAKMDLAPSVAVPVNRRQFKQIRDDRGRCMHSSLHRTNDQIKATIA